MNAATTFLIATRNVHKVAEIRAILSSQYRYLTLADFPDAPKVIEDATTFAGNATKKAVELAKWLASTDHASRITHHACVLADDSGLEVDALNGAPGVYSARFAALDSGSPDNSSDSENNAKLLQLLKDVPREKRTARFRCVLALTPAEPAPRTTHHGTPSSPVCLADELEMLTEIFDGACEGWIDVAPRGQGGFGYDPLFIPNGYEQSFAELGEEIKNRLSHRSEALVKLKTRLAE
jgi:XTP/dITP diphosphohydrolase